MTLSNIKKMKKEGGFTIVELLIVIVIIGILAALVIVAYNGIQDRARAAQYQTDAQAIQKKAEAYAADNNGTYPTTAGNFSGQLAALPTGVSVFFVTNTTSNMINTIKSTAFATPASETNAMSIVSGAKTYAVKACGTNQGLLVFYADPTQAATGAARSYSAGTTTSC